MAPKRMEKLIPDLRFSGFSGDWKEKKAGDLFINSRTKGNDDLPIYSVTLDRGLILRSSLNRTMKNDAKSEDNLLIEPLDIAYNMMRMWQGAFGIATHQGMISPAYIVLKPKPSTDTDFFIYFFRRNRSLYLFTAYSYGLTSDRLRLYFKDFAEIPFSTPNPSEQQKIATFLTAVDAKIQQLARKKELLDQYKKGVMQKLFSQELRFQDDQGNPFPDWEDKLLGDFANINPKTQELPKIFTYIDLESVEQGRLVKKEIIGSEGAPSRAQRVLTQGDIIFQTVRPYQKNNYLFKHAGDYVASTGYAQIRAKENTGYLYHYLHYQPFVNLVIRYSTGSNYPAINSTDLAKLTLWAPHPEEQNKIANFLTSIDEKIVAVQTQLTETGAFKKGLLQQMFI